MFWNLFIVSFFAVLYMYAFKGISTQEYLTNSRRIFRRIVLILFIPIHTLVLYESVVKYDTAETYTEKIANSQLYYPKCGKVTKKIEGYSKGENSKYEEYLVIKFDNGEIKRMFVSRQTFDRYSENSGICIAEKTEWNEIRSGLLFVGWLLSCIGIIICLLYANELEFT